MSGEWRSHAIDCYDAVLASLYGNIPPAAGSQSVKRNIATVRRLCYIAIDHYPYDDSTIHRRSAFADARVEIEICLPVEPTCLDASDL